MKMKHAITTGIALAALTGLTGQAFAHAHLMSEVPAAGASLAVSPTELDLTFSEGVDLAFTGIKVTGPATVVLGKPALKAGGDTILVVPLKGKLAAGTYSVAWHALSTDGHKTNGTYSFTVTP